jgi:hypothetical protein
MSAGFGTAAALASVTLVAFGAGEDGTTMPLKVTARWSFALLWLAYAGNGMAGIPASSSPPTSCAFRRTLERGRSPNTCPSPR